MSVSYTRLRANIVDYVRGELVGPRHGEAEILHDEPHRRYTAGTIYPRNSANEIFTSEEEEDVQGIAESGDAENLADDPIVLANQLSPASMGLSFYVTGSPAINVTVIGAIYKETSSIDDTAHKKLSKSWVRVPLQETLTSLKPSTNNNEANLKIFNNRARLNVIWRPGRDGWLITVTVINDREPILGVAPTAEDCIYQVKIICASEKPGVITAYPQIQLLTSDPEEHVLDLLYRDQQSFATGHGCSVLWDEPVGRVTKTVETDVIPVQEVPQIAFNLKNNYQALDIYFLAYSEAASRSTVIDELRQFVEGYSKWVEDEPLQNKDIPDYLTPAKQELMKRMRHAVKRMLDGVQLLESDDVVFDAFRLANRAMLMQMLHSSKDYLASLTINGQHRYQDPEISPRTSRRWRPFQLAFQLLTLTSICFPEVDERNIVDLIWFPTGGGKTEAYLAVSAFLILYRRLAAGADGAGTAVLMRYTLRLLTTQQFRRAATLICACELIRQENPQKFGIEKISIGLWVGGSTTPNHYKDAEHLFNKLLEDDKPVNPFQIERCPWCGMPIVPEVRPSSKKLYGIRATKTSFELYCPDLNCPFHDQLPIGIVDEQLYETPPTLLLATVDKFARMPWEGRVSRFFGYPDYLPPDLIIQDELHLISGPLGTIVGLYEAAIDALVSRSNRPPKIIASTATIRRATEQCMGLYARQVELFPPSGLKASDSYFAKYDSERPGRMYVGVLGPAHTSTTTMIRVAAALLQAPVELGLTGEELDAYWTLVAYHNSLRELGKSLTFASDDIPARIKVIATDETRIRKLSHDNIAELTSNIDAGRLSKMLGNLEQSVNQDGCISFLVCTNMLSVGVDISRLGLMLVNGQPKSTSEYIQATSRVGRDAVPGLVFCVYAPSKPRDRSHYERFSAYHKALYRYVEPTSVTPFAEPARERALHAVLVSIVRHGLGLNKQGDAAQFKADFPELMDYLRFLSERVAKVDFREAEATEQHVKRLIFEWSTRADTSPNLVYDSQSRGQNVLIRSVESNSHPDAWPTLNSMRNVDRSCNIKVIKK
jgi:hypothetical protein